MACREVQRLMKHTLFGTALMLLAAGVASALGGPYTVNTDTNQLVRIDPGYQSMTAVADLPYAIEAIEYSTDGFIYGVSASADTLVRIDPDTGSVEIVGPLGVDLDWHADLDEDDQGTLWMLEGGAGGLYTIDRTTGSATLQCQADFPYISGLAIADGYRWTTRFDWPNPPQEPGCGLEFLFPSPSNSCELETADDGWIYIRSAWYLPQIVHITFSRFDPVHGNGELLGEFPFFWGGLTGITFNPNDQPSADIPALGWRGAVILILLFTLSGSWLLMRRG